MLNQKSLPVWMLADALIVLSVGGGRDGANAGFTAPAGCR